MLKKTKKLQSQQLTLIMAKMSSLFSSICFAFNFLFFLKDSKIFFRALETPTSTIGNSTFCGGLVLVVDGPLSLSNVLV